MNGRNTARLNLNNIKTKTGNGNPETYLAWQKLQNKTPHSRTDQIILPLLECKLSNAKRTAQQAIRKDKNNLLNGCATLCQKNFDKNRTRGGYQYVKKAAQSFMKPLPTLRSKEGTQLTTDQEKADEFANCTEELLNRPTTATNNPWSTEPATPNDTPCPPPSIEETFAAIKKLPNNKAKDNNGTAAEAIKAAGITFATKIHELILHIWETEDIPQQWKYAVLFYLYKKGNTDTTSNYRGIAILEIIGKAFSTILNQKIASIIDEKLLQAQFGFRYQCSTIDAIIIIKHIITERKNNNQETFTAFIDLEKAFDLVPRNLVWDSLARYNVPTKIINLLKNLYQNTKAKVKYGEALSREFNVTTGVRQGSVGGPALFNILYDHALKTALLKLNKAKIITIKNNSNLEVPQIVFADDLTTLAKSIEDLLNSLNQITSTFKDFGLVLNKNKTEIMSHGPNTNKKAKTQHLTKINNKNTTTYPIVDKKNKFLGHQLARNASDTIDIQDKITKAKSTFALLRPKCFNNTNIKRQTQLNLYKTMIRSILYYAAESWTPTEAQIHKIDTFENNCLRTIMGIKKSNHTPNNEIRQLTNIPCAESYIKYKTLTWYHRQLERTKPNEIIQAIIEKGNSTWSNNLKNYIKETQSTINHNNTHTENPNEATITTAKRKILMKTVLSTTKSNTHTLKCPKCEFLAKNETGLKIHTQIMHKQNIKTRQGNTIPEANTVIPLMCTKHETKNCTKCKITCPYCPRKSFKTRATAIAHYTRIHKVKKPVQKSLTKNKNQNQWKILQNTKRKQQNKHGPNTRGQIYQQKNQIPILSETRTAAVRHARHKQPPRRRSV